MPYLIDGHNVISVVPDIDLADQNDEAELVLRLRAWTARIQRRAIVIFDGGLPGGPSRSLSTPDVTVIFAARLHTTADRIIHERLRSLPDPGNWTVVSSDREVLDRARVIGARTMGANEFAARLQRPPAPEKEKPDTVTAADVEAWLKEFPEAAADEPAIAPVALDVAQQNGSPAPPPSQPPLVRRVKPARPGDRSPDPAPRGSRTIAEQVGVPLAPEQTRDARQASGGKPDSESQEDIDAWLEVFHDSPESSIRPPQIAERPPRPQASAEPVVRKDGALSSAEVDAWLDVFGPGAEKIEAKEPPKPQREKRKVGSKLARRQQNLLPDDAEDEASSGLSDEDRELWFRMFGVDK